MMNFSAFRPGVILLALPVLAALLLMGGSAPSIVLAQDPPPSVSEFLFGGEVEENYACWYSGPFIDSDIVAGSDYEAAVVWNDVLSWQSTGEHDGRDFAVDLMDLGNDGGLIAGAEAANGFDEDSMRPKRDSDDGRLLLDPFLHTYFGSLPEYVDYAFYVDVFNRVSFDRGTLDRRVQRMAGLFTGSSAAELGYYVLPDLGEDDWEGSAWKTLFPREDPRYTLPWNNTGTGYLGSGVDKYLYRRSVASHYIDGVSVYSGEWENPSNPGGGESDDSVARQRDQVSNWLEVTEGTTNMAEGGGEVTYGTTEGLGFSTTFQSDRHCANQGVCDGLFNWNAEPIPVQLHTNLREQNDNEFNTNTTGPGDRAILVKDGGTVREKQLPFDNRNRGPSSIDKRRSDGSGYDKPTQNNTDSDQIVVNIVLPEKYRQDLQDYDYGGANLGQSKRGLPAMGFNPWTFTDVDGYRARAHNEWFRNITEDIASGVQYGPQLHTGYRQPSLSRPASMSRVGRSSFVFNSRHDGVLGEPLTQSNVEHIRWPVNLEDMSWYLYRVPSGGFRSPMWLYWLTPRVMDFFCMAVMVPPRSMLTRTPAASPAS